MIRIPNFPARSRDEDQWLASILDENGLTETWFICDDVSRHEGDIIGERVWTLMHVQESDAVPIFGAVVNTVLPRSLSSEDVQLVATGALGEDRAVNRDVSLEDPGICLAVICGGSPINPCPSNATSSIFILSSRVVEVWRLAINHSSGRYVGRIVRESGVGTGRGDGLVSQANEVFVRPPVFGEAEGGLVLGDIISLGNFVLEPGKKSDE